MNVRSVVVTGANRGIGLEFVKQLLDLPRTPDFIFATYRDNIASKALEELRDSTENSEIHLIKMDVTNAEDIEEARKFIEKVVGEEGLTFLINNAGMQERRAFPEATDDNLLIHFKTNTLGPLNVMKKLLPLLQKSAAMSEKLGMAVSKAAVLNISSESGSIKRVPEQNQNEQFLDVFGYRMSKTALNMAVRVIADQEKDNGVLMVMLCPGWVRTDMVESEATLTATESVAKMLLTLSDLDASHHGSFMRHNGEAIDF